MSSASDAPRKWSADWMYLKVGEWHDGESEEALHIYLGLTWKQYCLWVENPQRFYEEMGVR